METIRWYAVPNGIKLSNNLCVQNLKEALPHKNLLLFKSLAFILIYVYVCVCMYVCTNVWVHTVTTEHVKTLKPESQVVVSHLI